MKKYRKIQGISQSRLFNDILEDIQQLEEKIIARKLLEL
jgi:hypothetical protein